MGFLYAASRWGTLPRRLGGQLLARSLATGRFTGSLLRASHPVGYPRYLYQQTSSKTSKYSDGNLLDTVVDTVVNQRWCYR